MSRKRLSKKQLKGDRFVKRTFDWAHWAETHRNQVIAAIAGVLVLGTAFFVYRNMAEASEEEAAREYLQARQAYFAGNYPLAASDLLAFLSQNGDSSYADDARFFRAEALYESGDAEGAVAALTEFLQRHDDSPFASSAKTLLGAAYLKLGRHGEAIESYEEALEEAEYDARRVQIRTALADVYEAQGDTAQAVAQYRAILELVPEGEAAAQARRQIAELTVEPLGGSSAPALGETSEEAVRPATEGDGP